MPTEEFVVFRMKYKIFLVEEGVTHINKNNLFGVLMKSPCMKLSLRN